jgi:polysaccharide export outer membrane protein
VIDYFRMVHEGDFSQNLLVQDGDIVNIPRANEIFVLGNVGRPGPIKFEDKMTILQAVTLAGGPTPTASTKSTYILRQGPNGEEKLGVRLDRILENKEKNILIKTDDVIVVPESFF